ncbi:MAG: PH domain-containing protein [Cyanobacteria bacterium P01_A01_bin.45]
MKLSIANENLKIEFSFLEQLLAARLHKFWEIPFSHIEQVTTNKPQTHWRDLRSPGSSIPGLIRAGTYYTNRGKEFWYVTKKQNYLVIELKDEPYKRIILTIDENSGWKQQLNNF